MNRTIAAAMVYACLLKIAENSTEFNEIAARHPKITSRVKELLDDIQRDKAFNNIFQQEGGDYLINEMSKFLDQIESDLLKQVNEEQPTEG